MYSFDLSDNLLFLLSVKGRCRWSSQPHAILLRWLCFHALLWGIVNVVSVVLPSFFPSVPVCVSEQSSQVINYVSTQSGDLASCSLSLFFSRARVFHRMWKLVKNHCLDMLSVKPSLCTLVSSLRQFSTGSTAVLFKSKDKFSSSLCIAAAVLSYKFTES